MEKKQKTLDYSNDHGKNRPYGAIFWLIILVIGLLLFAIIWPRIYGRGIDNGHSPVPHILADLDDSLTRFNGDNGRIPTTSEGMAALLHSPPGMMHWNGPYITALPLDPLGKPFGYKEWDEDDIQHFQISYTDRDGENDRAYTLLKMPRTP
jgi:general secretion pathway protein G